MAKIDIFAEQQDCGMVNSLKGQKILIYGDSDTGKTYQLTRMEKPLLLMAEMGGNARNCPKYPINDWDDFTTIVKQLVANPEKTMEKFQTVIIDTMEELVARVEEKVSKRYGVTEIGMVQQADKGNPNGYMIARAMFKQQINLLTSMGLTICFISHPQEIEYTHPITEETYTKLVPFGTDKEKGSTRFVRNLCDFVIYTQAQGIDPETGNTIYSKALCKETKYAFARSRYAIKTFIEKFTAENLTQALIEAIEKSAKEEGAGLVDFTIETVGYTKEDYFEMLKPYGAKLHKLYPNLIKEIVETHLGVGRKLVSATDDEIVALGNIYGELVDFACERGIVID